MRKAIIALFLLSTSLLFPDGYHVRRWIPLKEQVSRSPIIIAGVITAVKHRWATRRAYGEDRKYVTQYRFTVRILEMLKNSKSDKNIQPGKTIAIFRHGGMIPGKWLLIREKYRESIHVFGIKKGFRCIVYCNPQYGGGFRFTGMDKMGMQSAIVGFIR